MTTGPVGRVVSGAGGWETRVSIMVGTDVAVSMTGGSVVGVADSVGDRVSVVSKIAVGTGVGDRASVVSKIAVGIGDRVVVGVTIDAGSPAALL